jgi:hypothetical protein
MTDPALVARVEALRAESEKLVQRIRTMPEKHVTKPVASEEMKASLKQLAATFDEEARELARLRELLSKNEDVDLAASIEERAKILHENLKSLVSVEVYYGI